MYFYINRTFLLKVAGGDQTWTADLFTSTMWCPYKHNNGAVKKFFLISSSLMSTTIAYILCYYIIYIAYILCLYAEAVAIVDN